MIELGSMSISRRTLLLGVAAAGSASIVAAGVGPAQAKTPQTAAGYQNTSNGERACKGCANFEAPASCRVVEGTISPDGTCKFWAKKAG